MFQKGLSVAINNYTCKYKVLQYTVVLLLNQNVLEWTYPPIASDIMIGRISLAWAQV